MVFAIRVQVLIEDTRVAVQVYSEPGICHGSGLILRAGAGVRVQVLAGFVMGAGCRKNHDKQLTHIVRVSCLRESFV